MEIGVIYLDHFGAGLVTVIPINLGTALFSEWHRTFSGNSFSERSFVWALDSVGAAHFAHSTKRIYVDNSCLLYMLHCSLLLFFCCSLCLSFCHSFFMYYYCCFEFSVPFRSLGCFCFVFILQHFEFADFLLLFLLSSSSYFISFCSFSFFFGFVSAQRRIDRAV